MLNFQCSFCMVRGEELMCNWMITGRWSLPQYGPVFTSIRFVRFGELSVRSIVELWFPFGFGLVPRFRGVLRVSLSSFRSKSATSIPHLFC